MKHPSGNKYLAVGVMSGTSLDGLDIAAVGFTKSNNNWTFFIKNAETVKYNEEWEKRLKNTPALPGKELIKLHTDYGRLIGKEVKKFITKNNFKPDLISSHGHTIFHQPENQFTFQAGDGHTIAKECGIITVADFRSGDVALGGQGAPLVPAGDRLLFSEYDFCLNLGGFANISYEKLGKRVAFDICPVNFILNYFAGMKKLKFDKDGNLGRKGEVKTELLENLNRLDFYNLAPPKSLAREWVEDDFIPIVENANYSFEDKLRTIYEHIAIQISGSIPGTGKVLITGGGAFNTFLLERIKALSNTDITVPPESIINYKEALIFAFLGVLRLRNETNCFASVTGALKDSTAGVIFMP